MADTLKAWLRTRLGVIIDLTSEMFGRYTRDGTLLAHILHSYDIISSSQLSTILRTQDPALSRVNLRTLRIWLKLINVTLSDECIDEISKGKGAAALQLYYKVYLRLEGKDRLHFIALQKERKYMPSRFDISKVSEDPPSYQPPEHPLSQPLIESADSVLWHKSKFWAITQACRRERQRFEALIKYPIIEPVERFIPEELAMEKKTESEILDEFACKHPPHKMKNRYRVVECCPEKRSLDMPYVKDSATAAEYTDLLKKRSEKAAKSHALKMKIQTTMMTEAWERLLRKQDRFFDEALGRRVLDQSRYEKRMMRKLCEVRDLRNRIVENRSIVDAMLLKARENELRLKEDHRRETMKEEIEDVEMEDRRMRELRWRIREEKMRRIREKHRSICLEIMEDLADIAVKMAEYRQAKSNHIPYSIWNEWKTSFLRNQPIFELVDDHFDNVEQIEDVEEIKDKEEINNKEIMENKVKMRNGEKISSKDEKKIEKKLKSEEKQKLTQLELERRRSLADADFESYRDLSSSWDQFVSKKEEKDEEVVRLGCIVLGYIVHRLLEILYPYPNRTASCAVPRVKIAAVISGIINPILHEQLRELLKNNGIRLLRMEDAINHCLERYKREMTDVEYIDLNIVSTTIRDIKRLETKNKIDDSWDRQKKIEKTTNVTTFKKSSADEKQTQTPRQIPYDDMDPVLSDTAYIGKWTYEFLTLGEPISDELNTKILIEYLRGFEDVEGWALINYPNTYKQMAMLEKALTGREVSFDPKIINFTNVNIEDIDLPSARIVFEDDEDKFATYRQSRLLPNPISRAKDSSSRTFMTIYVKAMLKSKTIEHQDQPCISLPDDATSIDEYYANENIAYGFFYNVLDYSTLKQLAEFIAGQIPKKQLEEKISQAYHDEQKFPVDSKTVVIKCLIPRGYKWETFKYEKKKDIEAESSDLQPKVQTQLANSHVRPGEDDWQWINFFQPPALLEILATFWESIEEAYVENLKKILSLKRMHTSAIVPYKNLVLRNLTKFVERPDKRQVLLKDFQRIFNEIDEDLRDDSDMKCELHCRVDDFRMELWDLCDARRHEAEEERKRILQNEWIPIEAVVLVNVYIEILQAEVDRFVDTMQLLQDYYTSMLQKPLQEPRFSKIVLEHVALANVLLETSLFEDKERMLSKIESIDASARRAINIDHFKTEIETLLIDISKSFHPDQSIIFNIIKDNIQQVRSVVNSISSMMLEMLQKEEKVAIPKTDIKSKSIRNASPDSTFDKLAKRSRDLIEEWRYAVLFEIDRINQRLDVLSTSARFNIIFLLDTMKEAFHGIYHHIIERYKREMESINEMANVFCFAIEEERPIQQELLLDGDQFVVKSNGLMFPEDSKRFAIPIEEVSSPLRFRMIQLGRLIDIFRRIAPHGIISERALIYVLQDLVSCGEEDCYPSFVPCAWQQLRPPDIEKLIEGLFGATEYIEWREFVVYAMDLPVPSHQDILKARTAFRMHDPDLRETITRDQFHSIPLWFLEISTFYEKLLDEEIDHNETMDIMLREEVRLGEFISHMKSNFIETTEDNSGAILRLTLAKELLCRMYLVNRNAIHYTAMLLAFCKDKDPREGLGKAFTLAMGARVCTDAVEGEKYVDELVEKKRRDRELHLSQDYLYEEANEVVREIINHIINRMVKAVGILEKVHDHDLSPKRIMIQQLNGLDEIDPSELLPSEETAVHLVIEDLSAFSNEQEYEPYFASAPSAEAPEDYDTIQLNERVIFWLPRNVCLTVLSTCLPWLVQQPNLSETFMSLREEIARVYDELRDEELNDDKDLVLSHRLLNHSFIYELLCASSKFVSKNMSDLLRNILKDRYEIT